MADMETGEAGVTVPRNAEEASGNGVARAQTPLLHTAGKIAQNSDQQQRQKSATPNPAQVSQKCSRVVLYVKDQDREGVGSGGPIPTFRELNPYSVFSQRTFDFLYKRTYFRRRNSDRRTIGNLPPGEGRLRYEMVAVARRTA